MNDLMAKKTILLNCTPPARQNTPSISLSVLKSFLAQHRRNAKVLYWNYLFGPLFNKYYYDVLLDEGDYYERDVLQIIPFLSFMAEENNDESTNELRKACLYAALPRLYCHSAAQIDVMSAIKRDMEDIIHNVIRTIDFGNVSLVGFTAKYHQWIAAIKIANEIIKIAPDVGIVIGGIDDIEQARELMRIGACFDYAIWGEGEYPLWGLCQYTEDKTKNIESIPRLVYRAKGGLLANRASGDYVDFDHYPVPDYDDYMEAMSTTRNLATIFPIESKRGCSWNRCNFCSSNRGYKYRCRDNSQVLSEIKDQTSRYGVTRYRFVDNDLVGHDIELFEELLDRLIEYRRSTHQNISIAAEILHGGFNSRLIKKMALAGLTEVQIGYEAITDNLLKKMNKKVDFADHLLFLKYAGKYGIAVLGANIIMGTVGETRDDVLENVDNLKFLRFFIDKKGGGVFHNVSRLRLDPGTRYYDQVGKEERRRWDFHPIAKLFPKMMLKEDSRFDLFGYYGSIENEYEWALFEKINTHFGDNDYTYTIISHGGKLYYREYKNRELTRLVLFDEPYYRDVLESANDAVVSFDRIHEKIGTKYGAADRSRLLATIDELQALAILYANEERTRIVSIIDTSLIA
ncbi:MAG: radical SAM protein [Thermoplasmata archaeon]|nr:radical SAM protein [Thermoplasmata archaeon]